MVDPAHEISILQKLRSRSPKDLTINGLVEAIQDRAEQTQKKLGELIDLWGELVPPEIAERTSLLGIRGGVLQVAAESSAIVYELDRLLREGLLKDLRSRYHGTLMRVKVQVRAANQA